MKLVRIDGLAPGRAELELHPQLTVLRGLSPVQRRRLLELFRSFAGQRDPGCHGTLEVGGVLLGLDRPTLDGLRLDPLVDPVLAWPSDVTTADAASPLPATAPAAPRWDAPTATTATTAPPVVAPDEVVASEVVDDEAARRLAQDREQLREVTARRTELGRRMDQVRVGLDSFANAALEVCVGQIDALEARRSLLRAQWERERGERIARREQLAAQVTARQDEIDTVIGLELGPVRGALAALDRVTVAPMEPDPAAAELALRLDAAWRQLRDVRGRVASAELRRREAEQRLAEARGEASTAERSMRARVVDPDDVRRLDQLRDEIFAFDDRHGRLSAGRNRRKVQELRAEEAVLLERLGFDTYSSYVMGIPSVRAELERSSRVDAAATRVEQIERELHSLEAEAPDPRVLDAAEAELTRLVTMASRLLGREVPDVLVTHADGASPLGDALGEAVAPAVVATEDVVHDLVTTLRNRRIAGVAALAGEAQQAAEQLRHVVTQLAGGRFADPAGLAAPQIAGERIDAAAWEGSPDALSAGVTAWLVRLQEPGPWVAAARASVAQLHEQLAELERQELQQNDVSEWAVVEAELDAALDRMAAAEERVRAHEEAMSKLAELRDVELELRARERELLGALANAERVHRAPRVVAEPPPRTPPPLPPAYRGPVAGAGEPAADEPSSPSAPRHGRQDSAALEWRLVERLAQQRAVSFVGSVPLLLDGLPGDGEARRTVCERARRMSDLVQIIVLSEDEDLWRWASGLGRSAAVVSL